MEGVEGGTTDRGKDSIVTRARRRETHHPAVSVRLCANDVIASRSGKRAKSMTGCETKEARS